MKILALLSFTLMSFTAFAAQDHNTTRSNRATILGDSMIGDLKILNGDNDGAMRATSAVSEKADFLKTQMIIGNFVNILSRNVKDNDCDDTEDDKKTACTLKIVSDSEFETLEIYARKGLVKFFNDTKGFGYAARGGDIRVRKKPGRTTYSNVTLERAIADFSIESLAEFTNRLEIDGDSADVYAKGAFLEQSQLIDAQADFSRAHKVISSFINNLLENIRHSRLDTDDDGDSIPTEKSRGITINSSHVEYDRMVTDAENKTLQEFSQEANARSGVGHGHVSVIRRSITATVVYINYETGNAVIIDDETGKEHFVHVSGLIDEINEGDEVEFELEEGPKGMNAVNVKVV